MMDHFESIPILDDSTSNDVFFDPQHGRGGEPRDYSVQPLERFASADLIPLIDKSEWSARIEELDREEATLDHVLVRARRRGRFSDLDQGKFGFCWGHSTAHAIQLAREVANQPPVALSAFGLVHLADASRALNNRGGWCGLSAEAAREKGVPSQAVYPQGSVKRNVNQAILDDAANYRVTEDFVDMTKPVWDQNLKFEAVAACMLTGRPCAVDFNHWGHSVCAIKLVQIEPGDFGLMILNSWTLAWGNQGRSILRGSKKVPDGAIAINKTRKAA